MTTAYLACAPHVPLLSIQDKGHSADLWRAYEARIAEFDAFDPELTVVFGGNHYQGVHLNLAPTFIVGQIAEAIDDCGGLPGKLDIPMDLSIQLADVLVQEDFDIATSYAMVLDHGFSNVLGNFLHGDLGARPVIPVHINSLTYPRATFRRCRQLGEAVGRWAATLGKRVAFLGSGGLSHQTDSIFPQYENAPDEAMRDYMVNGGAKGPIDQKVFDGAIRPAMSELSHALAGGAPIDTGINPEWDKDFLNAFASGDLTAFDNWTDEDVLARAGYGGGEVRMWVAAAAAGQAAGANAISVDYYSDKDPLAVGAAVAHSPVVAA